MIDWKRYMSLIIINYIVLILDTIYNKSNMVVKNSSAQPEDWFGNSNRNHKSIKQKGNPQLEDEQVKSRIWMIIVGLKDTITLLPRL